MRFLWTALAALLLMGATGRIDVTRRGRVEAMLPASGINPSTERLIEYVSDPPPPQGEEGQHDPVTLGWATRLSAKGTTLTEQEKADTDDYLSAISSITGRIMRLSAFYANSTNGTVCPLINREGSAEDAISSTALAWSKTVGYTWDASAYAAPDSVNTGIEYGGTVGVSNHWFAMNHRFDGDPSGGSLVPSVSLAWRDSDWGYPINDAYYNSSENDYAIRQEHLPDVGTLGDLIGHANEMAGRQNFDMLWYADVDNCIQLCNGVLRTNSTTGASWVGASTGGSAPLYIGYSTADSIGMYGLVSFYCVGWGPITTAEALTFFHATTNWLTKLGRTPIP